MSGNHIRESKSSVGPKLIAFVLAAAVLGYLLMTAGPAKQPITKQPGQTQKYTSSNQVFGFSFNYPKSWRAEECSDNASFLVAVGDREQLVICSSDAPLNAYVLLGGVVKPYWEGTVQDQFDLVSLGLSDIQVTQTSVSGVPATRISGKMIDFGEEGLPQYLAPGTGVTHVIFIHEDNMYRIYFQDLNNAGTVDFDKIVDSFRIK